MSRVEVLVACMNQIDDSLYKKMNLHTDAVLANQFDEYSYREYTEDDGSKVKLVSTADRGVGKNRNKALMNASGEYLLSADEDMIYVDNYEKIVLEAFKRKPDADMIVFNLNYLNRFTPGRTPVTKFKRLHIFNSMRYGAARIAFKRSSLEKACLSFSVLYGGGARYSSGEDSLFIRDAFKKKLKMYYCPIVIADVKQEDSSWFKGYTEKYFRDKGVLIANCFPVLKHVLVYYYSFQMRNLTKEFGFKDILMLMREGYREFKNL
ncbi:MAG: glycosyltransferase [Clostridia bacterium]|nr:glycosyltransferase [Clostridia bacterium]